MKCVYCGSSTRVTNSRHQKKANQVWRRRKCENCDAVFTTLEGVDTYQALSVRRNKLSEPFSRDRLLLDVYDSLRHRKTALQDATELTSTILAQLYPMIANGSLERDTIVLMTITVLERYDVAAAISYAAFHPVQDK